MTSVSFCRGNVKLPDGSVSYPSLVHTVWFWAVIKDRVDTVRERDAEKLRRQTLVALRRQYVDASDDVPDAWDRLGDALRAADQPDDAIDAWLKAEETAKARGMFVSTDTGRTIRLAQLDIAQRGTKSVVPAAALTRRKQPSVVNAVLHCKHHRSWQQHRELIVLS